MDAEVRPYAAAPRLLRAGLGVQSGGRVRHQKTSRRRFRLDGPVLLRPWAVGRAFGTTDSGHAHGRAQHKRMAKYADHQHRSSSGTQQAQGLDNRGIDLVEVFGEGWSAFGDKRLASRSGVRALETTLTATRRSVPVPRHPRFLRRCRRRWKRLDGFGEPGRDRTVGPLIKSQMLYP